VAPITSTCSATPGGSAPVKNEPEAGFDVLGASNGYSARSLVLASDRLPLHFARIIGAATFERKDVVDDVTRAGTGCGLGRRAGVAGLEGAPSCGAAADVAAGAPLASFADTRLGVADGVPLGLGSVAGFGTSLRRSTRCRCNREQDYQGQMLHTWGESSVGFLTDALDCESAVTQADRTRRIG